jgi:hypothetical protein
MTSNQNTIRGYLPAGYLETLTPYRNDQETFKGFLQKDLEQGVISNPWLTDKS